jgi:hypothetical protein
MVRRIAWFVLLLGGCAAASISPAPLIGHWGGEHVAMTATSDAVSFEFDCAAGRIDAPLQPSSGGVLQAKGVYLPGHGGPVRVDEVQRVLPAFYSGKLSGNRLTLSIELPEQHETLGPFAMVRGAEPRVYRCL